MKARPGLIATMTERWNLWKGECKIYFSLVSHPMRWKELKQETGFSSPTLSEYLHHLRSLDYIYYDPKTKTYYAAVWFMGLFPGGMEMVLHAIDDLDEIGDTLSQGSDVIGMLNDRAVKAHAILLSATMPALLYASLGGKGPYEIDLKEPHEIENLLGKLDKDSHDVADELIDLIIRPWIHKLIDAALIFNSSNKDNLTEVGGPLMKEGIERLNKLNEIMMSLRSGVFDRRRRHE